MKPSSLVSLESLLLDVRDPESKRLSQEAVSAYDAGAHRAAILSIWVAVCADIISKLRELSMGGDASATSEISRLERMVQSGDIRGLQGFEQSLIETARDRFGILVPHEATDLLRLREDRHLCAHPAMVSEESFFNPSAELARAHIVHACTHLLVRPPLQGKAIIAKYDRDLLGGAFPSDAAEIENAMRRTYLRGLREGTVASLIKALSKALVGSERQNYVGKEKVIAQSLAAIGRISPGIYESTMPSFYQRLAADLDADSVIRLMHYIQADIRIWNWITEVGQGRILAKLDSTPYSELSSTGINAVKLIPELEERFARRILNDPDEEIFDKVASRIPSRYYFDRIFEDYQNAGSFASAERIGSQFIVPHAKLFGSNEVRRLVNAVKGNQRGQILSANKTPSILLQVVEQTIDHFPQSIEAWQELVDYIVEKSVNNYSSYPDLMDRLATLGVIPTTTLNGEGGLGGRR